MYEIAYLLLSSLICGFRNIQVYAIRWNKENERMWAHKLIYTWKRIHVGPDLTSPHLLHPHTSRPFTVLTSSSIPKTRKGVNMLITTWTDHTLALGAPPSLGPNWDTACQLHAYFIHQMALSPQTSEGILIYDWHFYSNDLYFEWN